MDYEKRKKRFCEYTRFEENFYFIKFIFYYLYYIYLYLFIFIFSHFCYLISGLYICTLQHHNAKRERERERLVRTIRNLVTNGGKFVSDRGCQTRFDFRGNDGRKIRRSSSQLEISNFSVEAAGCRDTDYKRYRLSKFGATVSRRSGVVPGVSRLPPLFVCLCLNVDASLNIDFIPWKLETSSWTRLSMCNVCCSRISDS